MSDTALIITMHVVFLFIGACLGKWSSAVEVAHWKTRYEAAVLQIERLTYCGFTPRAESDPLHTPPSAPTFVQYEYGKSDVGPNPTKRCPNCSALLSARYTPAADQQRPVNVAAVFDVEWHCRSCGYVDQGVMPGDTGPR